MSIEAVETPAREQQQQKQYSADGRPIRDPEIERIMGTQIRAKYKIEILFGPKRTVHGPNNCVMQIHESGKHFHGGGDDKMFWCKDVRASSTLGCWGAIPSSCIMVGIATCPHCQQVINAELLTGERFFRNTTKDLASHIEKVFRQLDHSADVYCKYNQDDIRYLTMEKNLGSNEARRLRGMFIYTLERILTDTAAGSSLHSRLSAFLAA